MFSTEITKQQAGKARPPARAPLARPAGCSSKQPQKLGQQHPLATNALCTNCERGSRTEPNRTDGGASDTEHKSRQQNATSGTPRVPLTLYPLTPFTTPPPLHPSPPTADRMGAAVPNKRARSTLYRHQNVCKIPIRFRNKPVLLVQDFPQGCSAKRRQQQQQQHQQAMYVSTQSRREKRVFTFLEGKAVKAT